MIFYKAKRGNRKIKVLLASLLILSVLGGFFLYRYITREQHCIQRAYTEGETIPKEETMQCFDTEAELIFYLSEGRIVLPDNYTQEDVWAAIEDHNSYSATLEAQGNE